MSKRQHEWSYKLRKSEPEVGPVGEAQLIALVKNGTIVGDTLVHSKTRTKGKWVTVNRIPAIAKFIADPVEPTVAQSRSSHDPRRSAKANKPSNVDSIPVANPYAAPATESGSSLGPPVAAKTIYNKFQPLDSKVVTWLLRSTMVLMAVNALCFLSFALWGRTKVPEIASAHIGVVVVQIILTIVTGIFFLRWKYRAYRNLQAACVVRLKTSPGWVVASYFIPFVNLYRPASAMNEIQSRSKARIGGLVLGWWLLIVIGSVLERVALTAPGTDNRAGHTATFVAILMTIVAGYLLLRIIRTITEKQQRYLLFLEDYSN